MQFQQIPHNRKGEGNKMKKMIKHIAFLMFLGCGLVSFAQQNQQGQLEEAEIVIRKDRRILLPPATRNFEKMPQLPLSEAATEQTFSFRSFSLPLQPMIPTFRSAQYQSNTRREEITSNYVKLGYGNFGTPYAEGYFGTKRNERYLINLHARHLSSNTGPVFDENSGNSDTEASVAAKFFSRINKVSGSLNYRNHTQYYYGYNPSLEFTPNQIKQTYSRFNADVKIENADKERDFDYHFKTDWRFLSDAFESQESKFNFDVGGFYKLNSNLRLSMSLFASLSTLEGLEAVNRNFLNLKPRLDYNKDAFSVTAGANFAGDNQFNSGIGLYPVLKVGYEVNNGLKVFAGYEGDLSFNSLESSVDINPWVQQELDLRNTEKRSDVYAGFNFNILQGLRLSSGISYASLNHMQFFTNSATDSTRFNALYDGGTTNRFNIYSVLNFEQSNAVRSSLRIDFFDYNLATLADAWHRPDLQVSWNSTAFLTERLSLTLDMYMMGGLNGLNNQTGETFALDSITDLNLGGKFSLNDRFGVFLQVNNLFGNEYQRFLNYPTRGLQVLGGLSISF